MGKYTAVIIEPRKLIVLRHVLRNVLECLDDTWDILIFHGTDNREWLEESLLREFSSYSSRISLSPLTYADLDRHSYNQIMLSGEIYKKIPTETFIIFQADSLICEKNKHLLEKFMKYDYVGAPWANGVGNGGFSLRRKSKMLEVIEKCSHLFPLLLIRNQNEDGILSSGCLGTIPVYKPSIEEAKEFAVETLYHDAPFALHTPWKWHIGRDADFRNMSKDYDTIRKLYCIVNE
jgi:hypothetical protein